MTDIIISGANGQMGRVIADCIAMRDDCKVVAGIDVVTTAYSDFPIYSSISDCTQKADVIIDFSHPSVLDGLLDYAIDTNTPIVLSTTGFSDSQIEIIKETAKKVAVFFSFNMSLGINLMVELAKKATAVLGDQFDIEIIEKHHNQKIDAPSGTAIMLVDAINEARETALIPTFDRHSSRKKRSQNEIGVHAVRCGTIVGEHEIIFSGRDEIVTISHSARSKEIFAVGSINAAIFLNGRSAGLYSMSELI